MAPSSPDGEQSGESSSGGCDTGRFQPGILSRLCGVLGFPTSHCEVLKRTFSEMGQRLTQECVFVCWVVDFIVCLFGWLAGGILPE